MRKAQAVKGRLRRIGRGLQPPSRQPIPLMLETFGGLEAMAAEVELPEREATSCRDCERI